MSLDLIVNQIIKVQGDAALGRVSSDLQSLGINIDKVETKFRRMTDAATGISRLVRETTIKTGKLNSRQARLIQQRMQVEQMYGGVTPDGNTQTVNNNDAEYRRGMAAHLREINRLEDLRIRDEDRRERERLANLARAEQNRQRASTQYHGSTITGANTQDALEKARQRMSQLTAEQRTRLNALNVLAHRHYNDAAQYQRQAYDEAARGDHQAARRSMMTYNELMRRSRSYANEVSRNSDRMIRDANRVDNANRNIIRGLVGIRHTMWSLGALVGAGVMIGWAQEVTRNVWDAFTAMIKLNDELERSKAVFEGLGVLHTGKGSAEISLMGNAFDRKELGKAKELSDDFVNLIRITSARTGQSFAELMASAKGFLPDIMNKLKVPKGKNALIENKEHLLELTKQFLELGSVMKMIDPSGHAIKWHTFALQEVFQGSSGSKKDTGMAMFKSLMMREGIKPSQDEAKEISKLVNTGKVFDAWGKIMKLLERSGITMNKIDDMMLKTLQPNIDGVRTLFETMGAEITKPAYQKILTFFATLNNYLRNLFNDEAFIEKMKKVGASLGEAVDKIGMKMLQFVENFAQGDDGVNWFMTISENLENMYDIILALGGVGTSFLAGLFNVEDGQVKNLEDVKTLLENSKPAAEQLGRAINSITTSCIGLAGPLAQIVGLVGEFVRLINYINTVDQAGQSVRDFAWTAASTAATSTGVVQWASGNQPHYNDRGIYDGYTDRNGQVHFTVNQLTVQAETTGGLVSEMMRHVPGVGHMFVPPGGDQ